MRLKICSFLISVFAVALLVSPSVAIHELCQTVDQKPVLSLQQIRQHEFVQQAELIEDKLVITLDEPEQQNPILVKTLVEHGAHIQFVGELRRSLEDVYLTLVNPQKEN